MNQTAEKDEYDDRRRELESVCNPLFAKLHGVPGADFPGEMGTSICTHSIIVICFICDAVGAKECCSLVRYFANFPGEMRTYAPTPFIVICFICDVVGAKECCSLVRYFADFPGEMRTYAPTPFYSNLLHLRCCRSKGVLLVGSILCHASVGVGDRAVHRRMAPSRLTACKLKIGSIPAHP